MATDLLGLVNAAMALLGAKPVTALSDTTEEHAVTANALATETRDETLIAAPWNEAQVRAILYAYTEPATTLTPGAGATVVDTTGVVFTAGAAAFTSAAVDVGRTLEGDGVNGKAKITGFTSTTVVTATITEAFDSLAAIASGSWRLYNVAPAWGLARTLTIPTAALHFSQVHLTSCPVPNGWCWCESPLLCPCVEWRHEGVNLVSDSDELDVLYTQQLTDVSKMSPHLQAAIYHHLAAKLARGVTGRSDMAELMWKLYSAKVRKAQGVNARERGPRVRRGSTLIDVRHWG